jgi:hypothetical protein
MMLDVRGSFACMQDQSASILYCTTTCSIIGSYHNINHLKFQVQTDYIVLSIIQKHY